MGAKYQPCFCQISFKKVLSIKHIAEGIHLLNALFLKAYSGLWHIAKPVLRKHKRLKDGFEQRLVPEDWFAPLGAATPSKLQKDENEPLRIWIQAASGGEAWLAHSLVPAIIHRLAEHQPEPARQALCLLCTTCTRQGLDVLEKLSLPSLLPLPVSLSLRYFPLDQPELMRRAVRMARPDIIVLLETELWPGLLAAAAEVNIPVLVLNARMTAKSFKAYKRMRFFWNSYTPQRILAISPSDAERFGLLFNRSEQVELMSNIKFDRLSGPATQETPSSSTLRTTTGIRDNALLVVLASVREEEEDLLLPLINGLYDLSIGGNPVVVAVAPRHLHRIEAWQNKLSAASLPYRLRSAHDANRQLSPVYLWDTFGELNDLYAIADIVYVGGSMAPLGGQNFLEPLAQGIIPFVGPHIDNFLWAGEELFDEELTVMVSNPAELRSAIESELYLRLNALQTQNKNGTDANWSLARATEAARVRQRFMNWLQPRTGGSNQAAEAVVQTLAAKKT